MGDRRHGIVTVPRGGHFRGDPVQGERRREERRRERDRGETARRAVHLTLVGPDLYPAIQNDAALKVIESPKVVVMSQDTKTPRSLLRAKGEKECAAASAASSCPATSPRLSDSR